jgi:competence ComEA-like helix-hairpin-helix protein
MSGVFQRAQAALGAIVATVLLCGLVSAGYAKKLPVKPIDLNRATLAQLEELPGIGPAKAREILKFREKSGPFEHVSDLLALPGIGPKRFAKLRPYVTVIHPAKKTNSSHHRNAHHQ